jgi:hypothetical protein
MEYPLRPPLFRLCSPSEKFETFKWRNDLRAMEAEVLKEIMQQVFLYTFRKAVTTKLNIMPAGESSHPSKSAFIM